MAARSRKRQYAALPYVIKGRQVELCLITSRDSGRWIIPKGWPQKGLAPRELAALEAFEEAGLIGKIGKTPIGHFRYAKRIDDGAKVRCEVDVYPLLVESQAIDWPEKAQRKAAWVKPRKAAKLIQEEELRDIILAFEPSAARRRKAA